MDRPEFVDWLRRDSTDVFRAYCRVCQRSFDEKNMGEGAVKSHGAGAKHVANMTWSAFDMSLFCFIKWKLGDPSTRMCLFTNY